MAIDRPIITSSAGTRLLPRLGRIVKTFNDLETQQEVYSTDRQAITEAFIAGAALSDSDRYHRTFGNINDEIINHVASMDSWKAELNSRAEDTIIDQVNKALDTDITDIDTANDFLIDNMRAASASVNSNKITWDLSGDGAAAEITNTNIQILMPTTGGHEDGAANTGTCVLLMHPQNQVTTINPFNEGLVSETMRIRCVSDKDAGGTAGQETFNVAGQPLRDSPETFASNVGAGGGASLTVQGAGGVLANANFETVSTDVPASWILENTAAILEGIHVLQSTGIVFRTGSNSLGFVGSCSGNQPHTVRQEVTLSPGIVVFGAWVNASEATPATDLRLGLWNVDSCGWYENSLTVTGTIQVTAGNFTIGTSWTLVSKHFEITAPVPTTLYFKIKTSEQGGGGGDLVNEKRINIAEAFLSTPTIYNGMHLTIVRASTDPIVDDQWKIDTSNDNAGAFQTYWTRTFNRQLPSNTAGAETISDSWGSGTS